jgi:hypothetical protein
MLRNTLAAICLIVVPVSPQQPIKPVRDRS